MKRIVYIVAILAVLLPSCKKESWIDWRIENQVWLENNATQQGMTTTPTGLQYKVIREGVPTQPRPDDLKTVRVNYTGYLITGYIFDQGDSTAMAVSNVISGFAEGLKKMTPGAHYILYIPYDLGYGSDGSGTEGGSGYIPPYSTLIFDITLLNVI